ncbi:CO dehydrogenase maturation factor [Desulfitispora alkaliphila]|uniref:ATP-binding protein n=1 Tax=Desulfitispora alkaliphila TaxID=622674 RepID=UPI003D23EDF3
MTINIAVAGKGGVGKTTFTALLLRQMLKKEKGSILTVDADPNANLNEALGLDVDMTISQLLEDTKDPKAIPTGMSKEIYVEYKLQQSLIETEHVDLLVMGNPQGPGCYCYPNDLLRKHIEQLSEGYEYMVVDSEAGLEHLSRRTIPKLDYLFVISDSSARGVRSAGRVHDIIKNIKTPIDHMGLIVTKTQDQGVDVLRQEIENTQLNLFGHIPYDERLVKYDMEGKALFDLPDDSPAVKAVDEIMKNLNL